MNYRAGKYNGSGYLDMTAYLALQHIQRSKADPHRRNDSAKQKRRRPGGRKKHHMTGRENYEK